MSLEDTVFVTMVTFFAHTVMARSTTCYVAVAFLAICITSAAEGSIWTSLKSVFLGKKDTSASECIDSIVAKARDEGSCEDISPGSLDSAARGALKCFQKVNAHGANADLEASSASLEVIRLTLFKYCQVQLNSKTAQDVSTVAEDLSTWGQSVKRLKGQLANSLAKLQKRSELHAETHEQLGAALRNAKDSQVKNSGVVARLLKRSESDLHKLEYSRRVTQAFSDKALQKMQESRQALLQVKGSFAKYNDAINPSIGKQIPYLVFHALTFVIGLQRAPSLQMKTIFGVVRMVQFWLLCLDILMVCGFCIGCRGLRVEVGHLRGLSFICSCAHLLKHCLDFETKFVAFSAELLGAGRSARNYEETSPEY